MTERPEYPSTRDEFLTTYRDAWEGLDTLLGTLDAEQMVIPSDAAGWNVRDHVAHICAWEATRIAFLQRMQPWDGFGISREEFENNDIHGLNEILRDMTRNVSPDDVMEMLKATNRALLDQLQDTPDDVLGKQVEEFHPDWHAKSSRTNNVLGIVWFGSTRHMNQHREYIERILAG